VRIPHSGWPETHARIENIAFRVVLASGVSVVHLGDADVRDEHYATDGEHWDSRDSDVALPPYWYFLSGEGRSILRDRLKPELAVGVHVPQAVPHDAAARRDGLRDVDLFTRPGESRTVAH
jgi:L-ascorbate metabolism protein UlaG (beta-lactamase superfamily)